MPQRRLQGKGVPDGKEVLRIFPAWPANVLIFVQVHRKLDLKGRFYPRPKKLPVSLGRMAITEKEQRPRSKYREVDRGARAKSPVIHISSIGAGGRRRDRSAP